MRTDIDWDNVDEIVDNGGGYDKLSAGNYVCRIVEVKDFASSSYVRLILDIAEGEKTGYFTKDSFYADKPWAHNVVLSYKSDQAIRFTKGRLNAIEDSNPGFDAKAAWGAGELGLALFLGKLVGCTFNEEEYETDSGEVKCNVKPGALIPAATVRDGSAKPARHKTVGGDWISLDEAAERERAKQVDANDIPF